jgi:tRNA(fMet)-specific endonuclease VapC
MNGRYLLDTNIVIALFDNDLRVRDRLNEAEEVFVPSVVAGELYYGAYHSGRVKENLARVDEFVGEMVILACDVETARLYGEVKGQLRQKGRPIPENDLWITALARQYDLTLITRDTHFQEIEELRIEVW